MISFTYDGVDYRLEATAITLKRMVKAGFDFSKLGTDLFGQEWLWKGLFIAHHDTVPDRKRMEIYQVLSGVAEGGEQEFDDDGKPVDALMTAVMKEYVTALESLKRCQGNVSWKRT